ncbi:hypothetical protein [Novosphingobium cyanobacteriorum]|uniref:Transposase n=1 Tax=Novosphingobium cyanobacteriorum TaxID=3024215 RepID=A0ABT6CGV5_9SPHN|nr:hypothetical protein [Novosphingobium cyanobacteriorum]MDF8333161.1 hypothetical protein [Novosphingobium cyanobacteriorum]
MTEALTQCWFTRIHLPERHRHKEADGSTSSTCRYCHRPIVSWSKDAWSLATGLDVSRLAATASGRYLWLHDREADYVIHRYTVKHLNDEEAIEAFKERLRAEYNLDDPDTTLVLMDSHPPKRKRPVRKAGAKAGRSGRGMSDAFSFVLPGNRQIA